LARPAYASIQRKLKAKKKTMKISLNDFANENPSKAKLLVCSDYKNDCHLFPME
jgi:hypothetical protein